MREETAKLAGYFMALPEPAMRKQAAIRVLCEYEIPETIAIMHDLVQHQRQTTSYVLMLEALMDVLAAGEVPYDRLSDLYTQAKESGYEHLTQLILHHTRSSRKAEGDGLLDMELREKPLGMRKYMARHATSEMIDRLLKDPDPAVIYNLIRSPRITEAQVLRIASRRYSSPEIFKELLSCYRWQRNYRIKMAIIYNPTVPLGLTCKLIPTILDQDLKKLAHEPTLSPEIRELAQNMLLQRKTDDAAEPTESTP